MNAKTATKAAPATDAKDAKDKKEGPKLTAPQTKQIKDMNCSQRIRFLDSEGYTRSQITKLIPNASGGPLRYQHVRNVLEQKLASAKKQK